MFDVLLDVVMHALGAIAGRLKDVFSFRRWERRMAKERRSVLRGGRRR